MKKYRFPVKTSVIAVYLALHNVTHANIQTTRIPYYQGITEYATVNKNVIVNMTTEVDQPNIEDAYFFSGTRNRSANPVRIIWYGNPTDADGQIAQKGAINHGYIQGSLIINAEKSDDIIADAVIPVDSSLTEQKDYRSSISTDGEANAIDAYGWSAQPNSNDVTFTLTKIENTGIAIGQAELHAGEGSHRSFILTNSSANAISLYGAVDYGNYIDGVAVDGSTGGSRSAVSMRSSAQRINQGISRDATLVTPETINLSGLHNNTDFYGKTISIALERVDNQGLLIGKIFAKGNENSRATEKTEAQDYSTTTWASGNGINLRTLAMTQDKRTYSYEELNQAKLGDVDNLGLISGEATLTAGTEITKPGTNYTRSYDSGNGISVGVHSLRFAKHKTHGEIGNITNKGHIQGSLYQHSSNNNHDGIHQYSQTESYGGGNGINLFVEATQQILGTMNTAGVAQEDAVITKLGNINNSGKISGQATLTAGNGYGTLTVTAQGSGNGISSYLKAGSAQTYTSQMGNIHNSGIISGSIKTQAGISPNQTIPSEQVKLLITTERTWKQADRPQQVSHKPDKAQTCSSNGCLQTNALSEIMGSGNGISFFTNRQSGGTSTLGDIDNSGVISGYSEMYHGFSNGEYSRVTFLGTGSGIVLDQAMTSNLLNKGIISGNHTALLAKSYIDDSNSVSNPNYRSAYSGDMQNYGLMAGMLIAGNYDGKRTETMPKNQTYLHFASDKDPIQNKGTYVYFASKDVPAKPITSYEWSQVEKLRRDFQNPRSNPKLLAIIRDVEYVHRARTNPDLYKQTSHTNYVAADIQKIEQVYGGATSNIKAEDRIRLYFKLYDLLRDTETADKFNISYDSHWLTKEAWRLESNKTEILGKKNRLINAKKDLDRLAEKAKSSALGGELAAGFKNLIGMYTEYYNVQLTELNKKLNRINSLLTSVFGKDAVAIIEDDHLPKALEIKPPVAYGTIERIETAADSEVTIGNETYNIINAAVTESGIDSHYIATSDKIEKTIINGVGLDKGALVANQNLALNKSYINGLATALNITGEITVTAENTVINANGFDLLVVDEDKNTKKQKTFAVLGDDQANSLVLAKQSVINGNLSFAGGNDELIITDNSVQINGEYIDFGSGSDSLTFGQQVQNTNTPIIFTTQVKNLDRLVVNQDTTISQQAQFKPVTETVLNSKLRYQGNYTMLNDQQLTIGVNSLTQYGQLEVTGGNLDIQQGKLFIDAKSLANNAVTINAILFDVLKVEPILEQESEVIVTDNKYHLIGKFSEYQDNSELFDFTPLYRDINGQDSAENIAMDLQIRNVKTISDVILPSSPNVTKSLDSILANQPTSEFSRTFWGLSNPSEVKLAIEQLLPNLAVNTNDILLNTSRAFTNANRFTQRGMAENNIEVASNNLWVMNMANTDRSVWANLIGEWSKQSTYNGINGYKANHYGFVAGSDIKVHDGIYLGVNAGFVRTKSHSTENNYEKIAANTLQGGIYADWYITSNTALDLQLGYGYSFIHSTKYVPFANQKINADYDSEMGYATIGLRHNILQQNSRVSPFIRADYRIVKTDRYQEKNKTLGIDVESKSMPSLLLQTGIDAETTFANKLRLGGTLGIGIETLDTHTKVTANFISSSGTSFTVQGTKKQRLQGSLSTRAEYFISYNTLVGIQYHIDLRKHYINQQALVNFRFAF